MSDGLPYNREQLKAPVETIEFTEQETDMLLKDSNFESYTYGLKEKIDKVDMKGFLSAVPRNLNVLIDWEASLS